MALTRAQRRKTERMLLEIWARRDVASIPLEQFRKLHDDALVHLHRFWDHKDKHWVEFGDDVALARQPDFTDPPPFGWDAFDKNGVRPEVAAATDTSVQPKPRVGKLGIYNPDAQHKLLKTGEGLTPRQHSKLKQG